MKTTSPLSTAPRLAAAFVSMVCASVAFAQADAPRPSPTPRSTPVAQSSTELKHSDKAFIEKAAKAGQKEVQLSQIATERATNPQVREYAQMLAADHQQANSELATLAAAKGVTLPTEDAKLDKWSSKKATSFDKDYIDEMTDEHQEAVSLFSKAAKSDDPEIAAFAQKYLPKLQQHEAKAKELKRAF